jgi:hypothetical protein
VAYFELLAAAVTLSVVVLLAGWLLARADRE